MSSKKETERTKQIQEKCQLLLTKMLRDDDNKYCVDCDAKGPRWASWNLGVFLCIRCAGIHRNLGVHISRVKSVNLDTWTPEQVVSLEQMGNSRARAVYEAMLPDGFRRPQTDSALESFIRAKYEHKKYLAREWVPPPPPKVDWDKEIDEEIEKQKRKKKSANASSITITSPATEKKQTPVAIPLPKPKASTNSSKSIKSDNNVTSDLLGLSLSSESETQKAGTPKKLNCEANIFDTSSPLGSLSTSEKTKEKPTLDDFASLAKEEADFFNQSLPSTTESAAKLTKDKILALYGAAPTANTFSQNMGGFNNFSSYQPNTFPPPPNSQYPINNGQNNAFGAFQAFPTNQFQQVSTGPTPNGHFMMPHSAQPAQNLLYNNVNSAPFMQPTFNPVFNQTTTFAQPNSFPQSNAIQDLNQAKQQSEKISNQFGSMNLRDVWQ